MRREFRNIGFLLRYISFILTGIVLVGGGFLVYFTVISPFIIDSPWPIQLLTLESIVTPLAILLIYLAFRFFLTSIAQETFPRKFRQWVALFLVVYGYGLGLVFFAAIFEELTPFLPLFYRGVFLPLTINLILILTLTRTRLRSRFERAIKRLFDSNST